MTRKWYAIYNDNEMTPSALFANMLDAKRFAGQNSVIRSISVDSNLVEKTFLITAFADFNPKGSNV